MYPYSIWWMEATSLSFSLRNDHKLKHLIFSEKVVCQCSFCIISDFCWIYITLSKRNKNTKSINILCIKYKMKNYGPNTSKHNISARGYFRSIWTAVYRFWAHLIWKPKLGKPGEKHPCESKQISCKCFSFLAYQKSVQLLY